MFKPTTQYFKRQILPFGGYNPTQFMGMYPSINPPGTPSIGSTVRAVKDLLTDLPLNYLMAQVSLPERTMNHVTIYRHGRATAIPVGMSSPLFWSATFLLDEDFYALRYFLYLFSFFGGIENKIEYNPDDLKQIFSDGLLSPTTANFVRRRFIENLPEALNGPNDDYTLENLFEETMSFGKCDINIFALPKTSMDYELDIPIVRPLNLATPFLGRTFILKGTTIAKIGSIQMSADAQNSVGSVQIDFISDFMKEVNGVNPVSETATYNKGLDWAASKMSPGAKKVLGDIDPY